MGTGVPSRGRTHEGFTAMTIDIFLTLLGTRDIAEGALEAATGDATAEAAAWTSYAAANAAVTAARQLLTQEEVEFVFDYFGSEG